MPDQLALSYVLPLRHDRLEDVAELATYVRFLTGIVAEVLVVDGSPSPVFSAHASAFGRSGNLVHVRPDGRYAFDNGKVDGVLTGLEAATREAVVIGDEDVRWTRGALGEALTRLAHADVVRPQNYYDPRPWQARWDTARSLLNRGFGADYPGTLLVRRSSLVGRGYDGNAMFENLELMRTVRAHGGTVASAPDVYVRRLPPTPAQFWRQRVREAYDDFAQPPRLIVSLAALPLAVLALARRRPGVIVAVLAAGTALAERGRRRAGGTAVFPASCVAFTPLWIAERAVCSWLALASWVLWGGCRYRGRVRRRAANPSRQLRRRLAA